MEAVRKAELQTPPPVLKEGAAMIVGPQAKVEMPDDENAQDREVSALENGVHLTARKYNDFRMMGDRKSTELSKLQDEVHALTLETDMLDKVTKKETRESHLILQLNKDIATCLEVMEEKDFHRQQLEHMIHRLTTSQVSFDSHLHALEETVNESDSEYQQVKLLVRQLEAAKTKAGHSLMGYEFIFDFYFIMNYLLDNNNNLKWKIKKGHEH